MVILRVNVANALAHCEAAADLANHSPQVFAYSRRCFANECFKLREDNLQSVEVG